MSPRKKRPREGRPPLTDLEERVMRVLWDLGECSSAELIAAYRRVESPLAETTLRTVLGKLREKGYVHATAVNERRYRYSAAVTRESVARRTFDRYVKRLLDGSPKEAIAYLIESEDLSEGDIAEIRALLDAHGKKGSRS